VHFQELFTQLQVYDLFVLPEGLEANGAEVGNSDCAIDLDLSDAPSEKNLILN